MYEIRNLNIWKDNVNSDVFRWREVVLGVDVSKKEMLTIMKCKVIFEEIMTLVPNADIEGIKERRGGKFRFPMYINEKLNETELEALDLSVRASNSLHRAGFRTIGELVENINGYEDLMQIRNCGKTSVNEIMEKLFCYQYQQMEKKSSKIKYINRVLELNRNGRE